MQGVFREHGPPGELLCDNGPCFRAELTACMFRKWHITPVFSCAYRAAGNGIVERNHRTIKRMAARTSLPVEDMVFWYNNSPCENGSVPAHLHLHHLVRLPGVSGEVVSSRVTSGNPYREGDRVFVKPPNVRCTTRWVPRTVTGILSDTAVDIDGIPRHVGDIRAVPEQDDVLPAADDGLAPVVGGVCAEHAAVASRPRRSCTQPRWMADFVS